MSNLIGSLYLGAYRCVTWLFSLMAKRHLIKRVKRGKEDSIRWCEKLGKPTIIRPQGPLVWLHAVGLGETLALRGVIDAISRVRPDVNFLVTSSTVASARTFAKNLPDRTVHQFLPLDVSRYINAFLDHWAPDLVLWSEQDIWPNFIDTTARRKVPQVLINARMNKASFDKKRKSMPVFRLIYDHFDLLSAQDVATANNIQAFGIKGPVRVDGSLKPFAPPLDVNQQELALFKSLTKDRRIHLIASSHAKTETVAIDAFRDVLATHPRDLLIIAPRDITRLETILPTLHGLDVGVRSFDQTPNARTQVYIADTFGEMGLWYSLANSAVIGGTFSDVEGHNPWEAVQLGCAVIHGPRTLNFENDYALLDQAGAALSVQNAQDLSALWRSETWRDTLGAAQNLRVQQAAKMDDLIKTLVDMLPKTIDATTKETK